MEAQKGVYQYRKLEHADSIRLLWLEPAENHHDDLCGSLKHTTLSERSRNILEPYTALSYVWGAPDRTQKLWLDRHCLPITATLDAALRDMRDTALIHQIWADAICIDQSNEDEKGFQVGIMGRIYSTASHTIIHLPLKTPGMERLLDAASQADNVDPGGSGCSPATALQAESEFDDLRRRVLEAPWFTRAWVFQELVLSRDPWVQTNYASRARWAGLCKILGSQQVLSALRLTGVPPVAPGTHADPLVRMSESGGERLAIPLYSLLASRRGISATEPKDLIYAYLGVVSDADVCREYITVDYSQTNARVFYDAARYILGIVGLDFLLYNAPGLHVGDDSRSRPILTSWVPDWTRGSGLDTSTPTPSRPRAMTYSPGSNSFDSDTPGTHSGYTSGPIRDVDQSGNALIGLEVEGVHCITLFCPPTLSFTGLEWDIVDSLSMEISDLDIPNSNPWTARSYLDTLQKNYPNLHQMGSRLESATTSRCSNPAILRLAEICRQFSSGRQLDGLAMLHRSDVDEHCRLPRGKLAAGKNGSLHIVPIDTRERDIIVEVGPSHMLLVLRPICSDLHSRTELDVLNSRISNAFAAANKRQRAIPQVWRAHRTAEVTVTTSGLAALKQVAWQGRLSGSCKEPAIRHFSLVGEALCIQVARLRFTTFGYIPPRGDPVNLDIFTLF